MKKDFINNEGDLRNWFKDNYDKLGFQKIVKDNSSRGFPDFIMLKDGKKMRVELETKSSNFILHKHPKEKTDFVVCVVEDENIRVPIMRVEDLEMKKFKEGKEPSFSVKNKIRNLFKEEKVLTTSKISKKLGIGWNTAEISLLELTISDEIVKIKKEGVNLWMLK